MAARDKDGFERRAPRARASAATFIVLAILATAAVAVTFLLPSIVTAPPGEKRLGAPPSTDGNKAAATSSRSSLPAMVRAGLDDHRPEAEKLLAEALRRIAKLEGDGARIWGGVVVEGMGLAVAQEILAEANGLYDRQQYAESLPLFRDAIAALDKLAASKPERFRLAMNAGQQAFAALDPATARAQFEIALALVPGDATATRYLERARALPEVLANMTRGQSAETSGDLGGARTAYRAAAALDAEFVPARESLARVEREITTREYRTAVSEVHARLDDGNLRAAQAALERARKANPGAPELNDLNHRLQAAVRQAGLERIRAQVAELEKQEKWADAVRAYDQALGLDANAAFAHHGRARAQDLAQLHAALDQYIADPARLRSADPRQHAKSLFAQAVGEDGPALSAKRQRLAQLIAAAEAPVSILLKSDRQTEVTLQRIGNLGTFDTHWVELPPGRYVAIGSRAGYRDVRVPFDAPRSEPIVVQATEPIQ